MIRSKLGQSVLEYAVLLAAISAVIVVMFGYAKNSVRARLWVTQERINEANR